MQKTEVALSFTGRVSNTFSPILKAMTNKKNELAARTRKLIKAGEGSIPHMYLDTVGKVTIGVGNMLRNAEAATRLPFIVKETGDDASDAEIIAEFELVAEQESGRSARYYKRYTKLVLRKDAIDKLLDKRLQQFTRRLRKDFEGFDDFPPDAQLGLLDMAFNLGNHGLITKFPSFTRAARARDWAKCAQECRRKQVQKSRNAEVRELFEACVND